MSKGKAIVIYCSKRGSTKQYAEWIAEELGCELADSKSYSGINLCEYDLVIYGGWIRGSGIVDFDKLIREYADSLNDKLIVFGVGIANETTDNFMQVWDINFKKIAKEGGPNPTLYILTGAYDPNKVTGFDGMLMKICKKVMTAGKTADAADDAAKMLDRINNGVDLVARENINALVKLSKSRLEDN